MKRITIFLFVFIFIHNLYSQPDITFFKNSRDSLQVLFKLLRFSKNDNEKNFYNQKIIALLDTTLEYSESFDYAFDSIPYMGLLVSPDNIFRIFNWNIYYSDYTHKYFGFIQYRKNNKHKKIYTLTMLNDNTQNITNSEIKTLDANNWLGTLYYKIIMCTEKNSTYYMLLGWKGIDDLSSKKIIEPLTFDKHGEPFFGLDVFKVENGNPLRIMFEYSARTVMNLRYDEFLKTIVFDHLAPSKSKYKGFYQFYGTDGTIDGFVYTKGKWVYQPLIDAKNPKK